MRAQRGFGKSDWMVAVAIVVIVVALVWPVRLEFTYRRDKDAEQMCLADMNPQCAMRFFQYTQDFDGKLPLYDNHASPDYITAPQGRSAKANNPLIDDAHPIDCEHGAMMTGGYLCSCNVLPGCFRDPHREQRKLSYTLNGLLLGQKADQIVDSAGKVLEIDEGSVSDYVFLKYTAGQYTFHELAEPGNFNHFHGQNWLYADGHMKWRSAADWPTGPDDPRFAMFRMESPAPVSAADLAEREAAEKKWQAKMQEDQQLQAEARAYADRRAQERRQKQRSRNSSPEG